MYRKKGKGWLKHWDFILIDIVCIEIAFLGAYIVRRSYGEVINADIYMQCGVLLVLFDLIAMLVNTSYSGIIQRTKWPELITVIKHVTITNVLLLLYEYMMKEMAFFSRTVFLLSWAGSIVLCWGCRLVWKKILRNHFCSAENQANMLVISTTDHINSCVHKMRQQYYRSFKITAVAMLDEGNQLTEDHTVRTH